MSSTAQVLGTVCFALAVLHTFAAPALHRWAHRFAADSIRRGALELLGEVEATFGIWGGIFLTLWAWTDGSVARAIDYLDRRDVAEPVFIFCILIVAASQPVLSFAEASLRLVSRLVPLPGPMAYVFTLLSVGPLLGSFITEPAAMTVVAMLLKPRMLSSATSTALRYALIGVLFVNVSIGGVLTSYAAPPVLMVAKKFGWDTEFMFLEFGWRAIAAVGLNALLLVLMFRRELLADRVEEKPRGPRTPFWLSIAHLGYLGGVVALAHHTTAMVGLFLFFVGVTRATRRYQEPLRVREGLMVGFFLAGLVVLGGAQDWWLGPLLAGLDTDALFYGSAALTAITDNAALTYLGSQVPSLTELSKEALVAGAVTGGGLTVIANAPNPAGLAILEGSFRKSGFSAAKLFAAAAGPTLMAIVWFWWV